MPKSKTTSTLHEFLQGHSATGENGRIDLFQRITGIKEAAQVWLTDLDKNGYDHSERLEGYLDALTEEMRANNRLLPAEAFVLLSAVYMHDVGYWPDGKLDVIDHPQRSQTYILEKPARYLLGDFPPDSGQPPRAAQAVAWVALGHSEEPRYTLNEVPVAFPDHAFSGVLNLKMLAALLRVADETDDPYLRLKKEDAASIRSRTPLVTISEEKITWYWERAGAKDSTEFRIHLDHKIDLLDSSLQYLEELGIGSWSLVLDPQSTGPPINMAETPTPLFVGRTVDLEKLHEIIRDKKAGAITGVTGTGGIGKTELARMYVEKYGNEYPGGIFWASLKGSNWRNEATKIFSALRPGAEAMVFPDDGQAKDEVKKALKRHGALLVIDNVNEADDLIHQPGCAVLVTTRNKDAFYLLPRESLYPLDRFSQEEGLALLTKVLGEVRVNHDLAGAGRVVEILGGMPLAIEIASKHLLDSPDRAFTDYIGEVQHQVSRLKIEDNPDKNVIATLTLSLEQLKGEKDGARLLDLFEAVAVTAETDFTSETLGHATGLHDLDKGEAQKLVGKLYHRSLLEYSDEDKRFSAHPLVKQVAEKRLREHAKKEEAFRKNHCIYFLDYAQAHAHDPRALIKENDGLWTAMVQANQVGWAEEKLPRFLDHLSEPFQEHLKKTEYELALNYLAILRLNYIYELGLSRKLVALLSPLVENQTALENSSRAWMLNSLGLAYADLGEYREAIEIFKLVREIAHRMRDERGEGAALGNMGVAYANLGEYRRAIELYEQALEIDRRIGDARGEGAALGNMGLAYANLGEYRRAIGLYEQILGIHRRIGDVRGEGMALGNMGVAYKNLSEYHRAIELYNQQIEIARRIGDVRGEGSALGNMGVAYMKLGKYPQAIELYEQQLEIVRRIGDVPGEGSALGNMGTACANLGEYRQAIELYEQQFEITRRIGDIRGEGTALGNMGIARANLGEYRQSIELFEQHLKIARRIGDVRGEGNALSNIGLAYSKLGQGDKCRECLLAARAIYKRLGLEHEVKQTDDNMKACGVKE